MNKFASMAVSRLPNIERIDDTFGPEPAGRTEANTEDKDDAICGQEPTDMIKRKTEGKNDGCFVWGRRRRPPCTRRSRLSRLSCLSTPQCDGLRG